MYGIDLSVQFENLMPALGLGFTLAFLYDVVCFFRLLISNGRVFVFVTDMAYVVFCALSSFLLFLAVNSGHIRSYLVLAEVLAAAVYRLTAGILISSALQKTASLLKTVFKTVFSPLEFLLKKIKDRNRKMREKLQKIIKKIKINSQNPLKDNSQL